MSSGIPLSALGPAAQALAKQKLAAARSQAPTPAQSAAISARIKKGQRESRFDAELFMNICDKAGLPKPLSEFAFAADFKPPRKYRFDLAWPQYRVALEVDGGVFIPGGSGHNSGGGFEKDMEKLNLAGANGWRIIRVFPRLLNKPETIDMVRGALMGRWLR